jgi:Domain of unknown function (DUF4145)
MSATKTATFEELLSRREALISEHAQQLAELENEIRAAARATGFAWAPLGPSGGKVSPGHASAKEIFDSELEQAVGLLSSGYSTASAVVAGAVLETALRELCKKNNLPLGKLDRMNADLAKQGVYNANMAKRITALAGIRNSAVHGKSGEFTDGDVKSMIDDVGRFLAQHME